MKEPRFEGLTKHCFFFVPPRGPQEHDIMIKAEKTIHRMIASGGQCEESLEKGERRSKECSNRSNLWVSRSQVFHKLTILKVTWIRYHHIRLWARLCDGWLQFESKIRFLYKHKLTWIWNEGFLEPRINTIVEICQQILKIQFSKYNDMLDHIPVSSHLSSEFPSFR